MRRLQRYDALALTAGLWFLAKFLRYLFPPLFPTFRAEFGVSTSTFGLAFSALMVGYALLQFPSGALADRLGGVRVITAGVVVSSAGAALVAVADGLGVVVVGMLLVGVGTGAHKTVAVALMAAVYPDSTGRALGAMDTLGAFGGVGASAAMVVIAALGHGSWRLAFAGGAVVGLLGAALFARRVPTRVPEGATDGETPDVRRYLARLRDPAFGAFVAATVLSSLAYNGALSFLPYYLGAVGLAEPTANALYGALFVVSVVQPVTGEASDRFGTLRVAVATLGLTTLGLVGLLVGSGVLALGAAVVALGAGAHGFRPVRGAYLVRVAPAGGAGGSLGVVRTVLMAAGAAAPALVGLVTDAAGPRAGFGLLAASAAGALTLVGALTHWEDGGF
ncbi:MAG: MFS transporter [Halobacteriaceae archaeon]